MRPTIAALLTVLSLDAAAAECTAQSGERRVALLELYTSEGCNSCPPTDRWLSELPRRGYRSDRIVVLAYHVDYWDRLGWIDRFGQARFSERQRIANQRNGARFVYTPQLMLNGTDYRRSAWNDDFATRIAAANAARPAAQLQLNVSTAADRATARVTSEVTASDAQIWMTIYENALSTEVQAGENRGRRLQHDFVVRDLAGPFASGTATHTFKLDDSWNRANLVLAAFAMHTRTGEALQALALPLCR